MKSKWMGFSRTARRVLWVALVAAFLSSGVNPVGARVSGQDAEPTPAAPPLPERSRPSRQERLAELTNLIALKGELSAAAAPGALAKLDSHLQDLLGVGLRGGDVVSSAEAQQLRMAGAETVLVDIYIQGSLDELSAQLTDLGMQVLATNEAYGGLVEGYLPVDAFLAAAQIPDVRAILVAGRPGSDTGSVTSEGDAAHNGPTARLLGEDGAGVVVGVISDSMNQAGTKVAGSQASGDLPASITVILDNTGSNIDDEGRAMSEIIYDTAPGITSMYFSSGVTGGAAEKVTSINNLVSAGVDLIADDIYYLEEPFFQDGIITQAADSASAAGVAYFASAGNRARQSYEQTYRSMGLYWSEYDDFSNEPHDFDPGAGTDPYQTMATLADGDCLYAVLQWDNPWGVIPAWDFDWWLYDPDSGEVLDAGGTNNATSGIPMEWVYWCNDSNWEFYDGTPVTVEGEIDWWHEEGYEGPTPTGLTLKYIFSGPDSITEYGTSSPAINPDAASANGAMAVAAVWHADAGHNDPESFSSRGPVTRLFNSSGVRLGSPEVRQKPQVAGADCVVTSSTYSGGLPFGDGTFCGTSAAAPSVAGVAALVLGAKPYMSPAVLYKVLQASTIDCTASGNPDADCGYGFVLANEALILARGMRTDFDGDTKTDPAKFISGNGQLWWSRSSDNGWGMVSLGPDVSSYVPRSDFDGDGKADPAKFVQSAGAVYYIKSTDGAWASKYVGGDYNTLASGSDFDGDGKTDFAKYLQGAGSVWYYRSSLDTWAGIYIGSDASPYLAGSDYDGDGITDFAKYVPAAGAIWYRKSSTGIWQGVYIGSDGTPVSGSDFDGDGKTDLAKFLSNGNLWYRRSSDNVWIGVFVGVGTYITASDFDGDGKTDAARLNAPGDTIWYIKSSTGALTGKYMGTLPYQIVN